MRRRLIVSTFVVVFIVVALLGVPLAVIDARAIQQNAQTGVRADAQALMLAVDGRLVHGEGVDNTVGTGNLSGGRSAQVVTSGNTINLGPAVSSDLGRYYHQQVRGSQGETVTVFELKSVVAGRVRSALLLILAVAVLAFIAAIGMAVLQARRLSRPLTDLAETAERLGSGDPRPRHRRYGVPELDRVAEVIDHSAEQLSHMLSSERRLAADASHQLRTPLTALSMRLEEIMATDDPTTVKEEAAVALSQVERLTSVVQRLLTNAKESRRRSSSTVPIDVDQVIRQQVYEWRPAFQSARRPILVAGSRGLAALATPGAFSQVLSTLLENSLMHGAGPVTVRTRTTGSSVVIEVSDDGPGVPAELGARIFERSVSGRASTGLGLAVARELAEADGGRLELLQQRPPLFALFLAAYGQPMVRVGAW